MTKPIKFEEEEFGAWHGYALYHFLEVLNGEKSLETAREDLASFRNSKYYTENLFMKKDLVIKHGKREYKYTSISF